MTLVEFLRARLDEDEGTTNLVRAYNIEAEAEDLGPTTRGAGSGFPPEVRKFIDRQVDPARVLRDVERDRRIVEAHAEHESVPHFCRTCGSTDGPCETKRLLALPYADHPDYDPTWSV